MQVERDRKLGGIPTRCLQQDRSTNSWNCFIDFYIFEKVV